MPQSLAWTGELVAVLLWKLGEGEREREREEKQKSMNTVSEGVGEKYE